MSKILKVKDIAKQYGVSTKSIAAALKEQGIPVPDAENSVIPDDMVELVESYFADLYGQDDPVDEGKKGSSRKGGRKAGAPKREEARAEGKAVVPAGSRLLRLPHRRGRAAR